MYDQKLIQDFHNKFGEKYETIEWWIRYLKWCKKQGITEKFTYEQYQNEMEKLYRWFLYEGGNDELLSSYHSL